MFTRIFRTGLFTCFFLLLSWGLYGQFSSKCVHLTLRNSVLVADSDKQYGQAGAADLSGTDDFDLLDDDDISDSLIKDFSFSSSIFCLLYSPDHLLSRSVASKNRFSIHLRLLSSLSFLQTFRV